MMTDRDFLSTREEEALTGSWMKHEIHDTNEVDIVFFCECGLEVQIYVAATFRCKCGRIYRSSALLEIYHDER